MSANALPRVHYKQLGRTMGHQVGKMTPQSTMQMSGVSRSMSIEHPTNPNHRIQNHPRSHKSLVKIGPFYPWGKIGVKRVCKVLNLG